MQNMVEHGIRDKRLFTQLADFMTEVVLNSNHILQFINTNAWKTYEIQKYHEQEYTQGPASESGYILVDPLSTFQLKIHWTVGYPPPPKIYPGLSTGTDSGCSHPMRMAHLSQHESNIMCALTLETGDILPNVIKILPGHIFFQHRRV